jgi:hypothetical protein
MADFAQLPRRTLKESSTKELPSLTEWPRRIGILASAGSAIMSPSGASAATVHLDEPIVIRTKTSIVDESLTAPGPYREADWLASSAGEALREVSEMHASTHAAVNRLARQVAIMQEQLDQLGGLRDVVHPPGPEILDVTPPHFGDEEELADWLAMTADRGLASKEITALALEAVESVDPYTRAMGCRALAISAPESAERIRQVLSQESNETARRLMEAALKSVEV